MAPLYEYRCLGCQKLYEELSSHGEAPNSSKCPHCGSQKREKTIQAFRVGGRGDLRESTLHGCHDAHVDGPGDDGHAGHHHDDESG